MFTSRYKDKGDGGGCRRDSIHWQDFLPTTSSVPSRRVGMSPFAPRKNTAFAERKATLSSSPIPAIETSVLMRANAPTTDAASLVVTMTTASALRQTCGTMPSRTLPASITTSSVERSSRSSCSSKCPAAAAGFRPSCQPRWPATTPTPRGPAQVASFQVRRPARTSASVYRSSMPHINATSPPRIGVDQQRASAALGQGGGQSQRDGSRAHPALAAGHHDQRRPIAATRRFRPIAVRCQPSQIVSLVQHE